MTSPAYRLIFGNFNMTSGRKSGATFSLTDTVGQTAPGQFGSTGSIVKSGFQYLYPFEEFSFRVDTLDVNLGQLTPNIFATATQTLEVTSKGLGGYSVSAFEEHPLQHTVTTATNIADTLCDVICSETLAGSWNATSRFGFGFNISGADVPADFVNASYFRQFADQSASETPQVVMSSTLDTNATGVVTYKANVSSTQPIGTYQTVVTYTAIPGF